MPYDAFVSHSTAAGEEAFLEKFRRSLQDVGAPWYRRRRFDVYLDRTSLGASDSLDGALRKALDESDRLVLMASPRAKNSPGVRKELEYWLETKGYSGIIIVLVDGNIAWSDEDFLWEETTALPECLAGVFPSEPKWTDVSNLRGDRSTWSLRHGPYLRAVASTAGAFEGQDTNDLSDDMTRILRRRFQAVTAAVLILVALTIALVVAAARLLEAQRRTKRALAYAASDARPQESWRLLAELVSTGPEVEDRHLWQHLRSRPLSGELELPGRVVHLELTDDHLLARVRDEVYVLKRGTMRRLGTRSARTPSSSTATTSAPRLDPCPSVTSSEQVEAISHSQRWRAVAYPQRPRSRVCVWDTHTGRVVRSLWQDNPRPLTIAVDDAVGDDCEGWRLGLANGPSIEVIETCRGKPERFTLAGHPSGNRSLAFGFDGELYSGGSEGLVRRHRYRVKRGPRHGHEGLVTFATPVGSIDPTRGKGVIVSGAMNDPLRIRTSSGAEIPSGENHLYGNGFRNLSARVDDWPTPGLGAVDLTLAVAEDRALVYLDSADTAWTSPAHLARWVLNPHDVVADRRVSGGDAPVGGLDFAQKSLSILTSTRDGLIVVWDWAPGPTSDANASTGVWSPRDGFPKVMGRTGPNDDYESWAGAISSDGEVIVYQRGGSKVESNHLSADRRCRLDRLVDAGRAKPIASRAGVWVDWNDAGDRLAVIWRDGTVALWSGDDLSARFGRGCPAPDHVGDIDALVGWYFGQPMTFAFAPNGRSLAISSTVGVVAIKDLDRPAEPAQRLVAHEGHMVGVAFDWQGEWLTTSGADGTVRLHQLVDGTWTPNPTAPAHAKPRSGCAFRCEREETDRGDVFQCSRRSRFPPATGPERPRLFFAASADSVDACAAPSGADSDAIDDTTLTAATVGHELRVVGSAAGGMWTVEPGERRRRPLQSAEGGAVRVIGHVGPGVVAAGFEGGQVGLWSTTEGRQLETWKLHGSIERIRFDRVRQKVCASSLLGESACRDVSALWVDERVMREMVEAEAGVP